MQHQKGERSGRQAVCEHGMDMRPGTQRFPHVHACATLGEFIPSMR